MLLRSCTCVPNVRSCIVSFTDCEGIEHSVRVPWRKPLRSRHRSHGRIPAQGFVRSPAGSGDKVDDLRVKAPEEEHAITVGKVMLWLEGVAASPEGTGESFEWMAEELKAIFHWICWVIH